MRSWFKQKEPIPAIQDPAEAARAVREAIRALRFNVMRRAEEGDRVFLITSTSPKEGKSTIAALLAESFARMGKATLLVDADLRRPVLAKRLGIEGKRGLRDLLKAGAKARSDEYIKKLPSGVSVLPSGKPTNDAADALAEPALKDYVQAWRETYAIVILDAPPVLAATDACALAPLADAVVIVAASGETTAQEAAEAKTRIEEAGGKLLGVVLNKCSEEMASGDYLPYGAYYTTKGE